MKSLSWWAHTHPRMARCVIVAGHLLLILLALFAGRAMSDMGWSLPRYILVLLIGLYFLFMALYPSKDQRKKAGADWGYIWQKTGDVGILLIGFLMVTWVAAHPNAANSLQTPLYGAITISKEKEKPTAQEILSSLEHRDKKSLTRQEKRILRKEFRHQIKIYAKATLEHDPETRDKTALIILALIAAVGLTLLLGALVCSISCGGAEGLAVVVGILGLVAIVAISIAVIRGIKRGPRKRRLEEAPEKVG